MPSSREAVDELSDAFWHNSQIGTDFAPLDERNVAVPVLAPWRAIYWALVMRGSFAVWEATGEIAGHCSLSAKRAETG